MGGKTQEISFTWHLREKTAMWRYRLEGDMLVRFVASWHPRKRDLKKKSWRVCKCGVPRRYSKQHIAT